MDFCSKHQPWILFVTATFHPGTGVSCPLLYEFVKMPQGNAGALASFQHPIKMKENAILAIIGFHENLEENGGGLTPGCVRLFDGLQSLYEWQFNQPKVAHVGHSV